MLEHPTTTQSGAESTLSQDPRLKFAERKVSTRLGEHVSSTRLTFLAGTSTSTHLTKRKLTAQNIKADEGFRGVPLYRGPAIARDSWSSKGNLRFTNHEKSTLTRTFPTSLPLPEEPFGRNFE